MTVPARVGDIADGVVWLPGNSDGVNLARDLKVHTAARSGSSRCRSDRTSRSREGRPDGYGRRHLRRRDNENLTIFGQDPWWLVVIKVVLAFVILMVFTLFNIWFERRVVARMQHRIGPNVHGPFGLLQSLADGVKLMLKEDIVPKAVDKVVFILAPLIAAIPAFLAIAVIPFGPEVTVPFTDIETPLQLTDLPVAVLYILAVASVGIYGIVLAGWSSGSTYSLLGALRSSAQIISYEVAMGLSLVAVFLYAGTMSTSGIVEAQEDLWFGDHLAAVVHHLHDLDDR